MQFEEISCVLEGIPFDTLREDSGNYFEAVIIKTELAKLTARLQKFFGSPEKPSKEIWEILKSFGGIWPKQTLYLRNEGKNVIFAMLWPWQDGEHITVKVGRNKNKGGK